MKTPLTLLSAGLMLLFAVVPQQDGQKRAFQQAQFESYRNILVEYDLDPSARGAQQFLRSMFPNEQTSQEIENYIAALNGAKFADRVNAEKKLATMGPPALQRLKQAVKNGGPETIMRARRASETIEKYTGVLLNAAINVLKYDPADEPAASDRLETFFELCRKVNGLSLESELKQAIIFLAEPILKDQILAGVEDQNALVRISCIRAMKHCLSGAELEGFVHLLSSDDDFDSLAAIESFGFLDPTEAVQLIISRHLNSTDREVRLIAINFLRAMTMQNFGYGVDAGAEQRAQVIQKWEAWFAESKPISKDSFDRTTAETNQEPKGFLISVNNKGVRQYDFEGKKVLELAGDTYDARQINSDLMLVTFRNLGEVRLIREGRTIQTVSQLNSPSDAEYLPNGNILVAHGTGKVTEHDSTGQVVKTFQGFSNPFDCDRLPNGNTIVADSSNNRIVEVDSTGQVVWECRGLKFPNNVFRLPDGRTLYTTYTSGIVALLGADGTELWSYKIKNGTLYSVYCAKGKIYVSDGANRKIWILDMAGELIHGVAVPESFCDVSFPVE